MVKKIPGSSLSLAPCPCTGHTAQPCQPLASGCRPYSSSLLLGSAQPTVVATDARLQIEAFVPVFWTWFANSKSTQFGFPHKPRIPLPPLPSSFLPTWIPSFLSLPSVHPPICPAGQLASRCVQTVCLLSALWKTLDKKWCADMHPLGASLSPPA